MDPEDRIVTLVDEEGEAFEFVIIDSFIVEEQEYAIMVPMHEEGLEGESEDIIEVREQEIDDPSLETDDEDIEEEEAVIFRLCRDETGETSFQLIEDEEEWEKVSTVAFERLYQEEE